MTETQKAQIEALVTESEEAAGTLIAYGLTQRAQRILHHTLQVREILRGGA